MFDSEYIYVLFVCLFVFSLFHIIIFFYNISVVVVIITNNLSSFFSNSFGCLFINDSNRSYNV